MTFSLHVDPVSRGLIAKGVLEILANPNLCLTLHADESEFALDRLKGITVVK